MEVEILEKVSDSTTLLANNTSPNPMSDGPVVIVRAEEVLLVVLVLILWVAAIALFFNRWGKIRMLEPYQPKFQSQNHRPSCPLAPLSPPHITPQARMSFSKYNVNCFSDYSGLPSPNAMRRPRLNSVFVGGSSTMAFMNPPRRVKSAIDIQHLIVNEKSPTYSSMLPMISYRERKPSITIERAHAVSAAAVATSKHRASMTAERPLLSHYQQMRTRRSSCAVDTTGRHRNFASFEQPRRKASIAIDRSSYSCQGPTISFEASSPTPPTTSVEGGGVMPLVVVNRPKYSRSFEQPQDKTLPLPRMAASLDVHAVSFDRRASIPEEEVETPSQDLEHDLVHDAPETCRDGAAAVVITFDEAEITANAPLLERLKSSDV